MIFIILLSIIFVALSVWIDAEHLNKYQYIGDHTSRAILRLFVFALIGGSIDGFKRAEKKILPDLRHRAKLRYGQELELHRRYSSDR